MGIEINLQDYKRERVTVQDLHGQYAMVRKSALKPQYHDDELRVVQVTGGFGCDAGKLGSAVFVRFLHDQERARFNRRDIEFVLVKN